MDVLHFGSAEKGNLRSDVNGTDKLYKGGVEMERFVEKVNLPYIGEFYVANADEVKIESMTALQDILKKLYDYEEAEEQGLLVRLPCKVGDTVYVICDCNRIPLQLDGTFYDSDGGPGTATGYYCPYIDCCPHDCDDFTCCEDYTEKKAVFEDVVSDIRIGEFDICIYCENTAISGTLDCGYIFLSREAAEQAVKETEDGNAD